MDRRGRVVRAAIWEHFLQFTPLGVWIFGKGNLKISLPKRQVYERKEGWLETLQSTDVWGRIMKGFTTSEIGAAIGFILVTAAMMYLEGAILPDEPEGRGFLLLGVFLGGPIGLLVGGLVGWLIGGRKLRG